MFLGLEEKAQWLRPLTALAEDPRLILAPHGSLQLSVITVQEDMMPSSGLHKHAHGAYTDIWTSNHTHQPINQFF